MRLAVWRARTSQEVVVHLDEAMDLDDPGNADAVSPPKGPQELRCRLRALSNRERGLMGVLDGVWVDAVSTLSERAGLRMFVPLSSE